MTFNSLLPVYVKVFALRLELNRVFIKMKIIVSGENVTGGGTLTGPLKVRHSKNYASPDCGAKVVGANPEAVSASSVLSPSRDEYLLNTCNARIWFIVELCEAIQPKKVSRLCTENDVRHSLTGLELNCYCYYLFPILEFLQGLIRVVYSNV